MEITYLSNVVFNADFLFALAFLTLIIWVLLKEFFGYESFGTALGVAVLAIIFLPVMLEASAVGSAFLLILLLGALAFSEAFNWSLTTGILVALIALYSAAVILPLF